MVEIIPIGIDKDFYWYIERLKDIHNKAQPVYLLHLQEGQSEGVANSLKKSLEYFYAWKNVTLRPLVNDFFFVYDLMVDDLYKVHADEPFYINLGNDIPPNVYLGLYNSLTRAPRYSRAYFVFEISPDIHEIRYLPSPMTIKGTAFDVLKCIGKEPQEWKDSQSIEDTLHISEPYLAKILRRLEMEGFVSTKSELYNKKRYRFT